jgi:NTP pyrophosphatase (non-canonical NTP hydrolase)
MSFKKIQQDVDYWIGQHKVGYFSPHAILARITEEVGELAREINHRWGPKPKKSTEENIELGDEIGDIIFALCCLANSQGIDLDQVWQGVMDKCYNRDKDRYEKKPNAS